MTKTKPPKCTPINLAPGVDLMVRADVADDVTTKTLVERCKTVLDTPPAITLSPEKREMAVDAVVAYATVGRDEDFAELVGISWCRHNVTDDQEQAAICAMAPLLDDDRLVTLMFHIADMFVGRLNDEHIHNIGGCANLHLGFDNKGIDPEFIDDMLEEVRAAYKRAIERSVERGTSKGAA